MPTDKIICLDKTPSQSESELNPAPPSGAPAKSTRQLRNFLLAAAVLVICFCVPLYRLVRFALHEDLYSYIPLMPFVTWYLIRSKCREPLPDSEPWRGPGIALLIGAAALLGWYFLGGAFDGEVAMQDYLAVTVLAFFLAVLGAAGIFLGKTTLRAFAFPLCLLIFMVPMPVDLQDWVENFLQYGSAYTTAAMYRMSFTHFHRHDLIFYLPADISLRVAPECSGIHSTWILLITSLLAGYLFLRSPWRRAILAAVVLPLALVRNGFRIWTIGELCVHISPKMIDSPIHRQGGPLFFALSLIPFFMLLAWLYKSENKAKTLTHPNSN